MEQFTAKAVFDLYDLLSNERKVVFLKLVGCNSTAESPFVVARELPVPERARFTEMVAGMLADVGFYAFVQREAVKVVCNQMTGQVNEDAIKELEKALDDHLGKALPAYDAGVVEVAEAKRKEKQYPANKVKDRRKAIRELLTSHPKMTPKQIREYLLEHHGELATTKKRPVAIKTILNDLADIRK